MTKEATQKKLRDVLSRRVGGRVGTAGDVANLPRAGVGLSMDNPLCNSPCYLLQRTAKSRHVQLTQHLERLGVGVFEASIVVLIATNPGISQAECGRMLSIKAPNLNPIIRRFIERKLIDSTHGRGRTLCLRLTPRGEELACSIAEFEAQEARIYSAVPEHLRHDLVPLLRAIWCVA